MEHATIEAARHLSDTKPSQLSLAQWAELTGFDLNDLIAKVDFYFEKMDAYDNSIYRLPESRIAHWIGFGRQNWFAKRIDMFLERATEYDACLDIGYSVPYAYDNPCTFLRSGKPKFIFVDKEKSAEFMHHILVDHYQLSDFSKGDAIVIADVESASGQADILSAVESNVGSANEELLIVCSEIVEHLNDADGYWRFVKELALRRSAKTSVFVTLPIGKIIPSHTMEFASTKEAEAFVSDHLDIRDTTTLLPKEGEFTNKHLRACACIFGDVRTSR